MREVAQQRLGHPAIQNLAKQILLSYGVRGNNYLDEAWAIGDFVKQNVRYLRDPVGTEQLTDPLLLIQQIQTGSAQGDCDDQSLLAATLIGAIGGEPYYRTVRFKRAFGSFDHIYVVVYDQNGHRGERERLVIDPILKDQPIGYEIPHRSGTEYAAV